MNRQQRRRKQAMERSNQFVQSYVNHLPLADLDHLNTPGLSHIVLEHDDWCSLYSGRGTTCNCSPNIRVHAEPRRS